MRRKATMNRMMSWAGLAALGVLIPAACIPLSGGHDSGRTIFSTRWIKTDSILAYGVYEWKRGRAPSAPGEGPESSGSLIRLYAVDVTQGCSERRQVHVVADAVPCFDVGYRAEDSLLYVSYLPLNAETKGLVGHCGRVPEGVPLLLAAGRTTGAAWSESTLPVDTAALLSSLDPSVSDVYITPHGSICPTGCGCFGE